MSAIESTEHLLALKVMRLTRPTLVGAQVITCEPNDLPQSTLQQIMRSDGTNIAEVETLAAGQFLLLPQSFGNIYLGETFSSYICVHNCTSLPVDGVNVKANLQGNDNRINLLMNENSSKPRTLAPDDTLDDIISYEVKEIGTHILVCEVNYISTSGLSQYFRKFFKFQVLKPLDIKTKFFNAEIDEIFLEAQIQNITTAPFCLEKVELVSTDEYTVTALNTLPNGESVFSAKNMLQPNNSCQFLYCIKPKPEIAKDLKFLQEALLVGKLNIVWRSNMGERACLQTSQLQRCLDPFVYEDVRLEILEAKNVVKIGELFTFICRITNTTDHAMNLTARLPIKLNLKSKYTGPSTIFSIGTIEPREKSDFSLTVIPTQLGMVKISPLILINTLLQKQYTITKVVEVFVVDKDCKEEEIFSSQKFVKYDLKCKKSKASEKSMRLQVV